MYMELHGHNYTLCMDLIVLDISFSTFCTSFKTISKFMNCTEDIKIYNILIMLNCIIFLNKNIIRSDKIFRKIPIILLELIALVLPEHCVHYINIDKTKITLIILKKILHKFYSYACCTILYSKELKFQILSLNQISVTNFNYNNSFKIYFSKIVWILFINFLSLLMQNYIMLPLYLIFTITARLFMLIMELLASGITCSQKCFYQFTMYLSIYSYQFLFVSVFSLIGEISHINGIYKVTENYITNLRTYHTAFLLFVQTFGAKTLKFYLSITLCSASLYYYFSMVNLQANFKIFVTLTTSYLGTCFQYLILITATLVYSQKTLKLKLIIYSHKKFGTISIPNIKKTKIHFTKSLNYSITEYHISLPNSLIKVHFTNSKPIPYENIMYLKYLSRLITCFAIHLPCQHYVSVLSTQKFPIISLQSTFCTAKLYCIRILNENHLLLCFIFQYSHFINISLTSHFILFSIYIKIMTFYLHLLVFCHGYR